MTKKPRKVLKSIKLGQFVHGGQTVATLKNGKKVLVWGGLPGEVVDVEVFKSKKTYFEALAINIVKASVHRIAPKEPISFLSTSPWQIMDFKYENKSKQQVLVETFARAGVKNINFEPFYAAKNRYGYRNKQEYGFWGDESGLNIAHFKRGTHSKQPMKDSILVQNSINQASKNLVKELNKRNIWAGHLKSVIFRSSTAGKVVSALFTKSRIDLEDFKLPDGIQGLNIYYSDPKSPASIPTKKLYSFGDITITDQVLDQNITYDVLSFFQVNMPVFEIALKQIKTSVNELRCIDLFSGVGTIGLSLPNTVALIESDDANVKMAKLNAKSTSVKVIKTAAEKAQDYIQGEAALIVDPPRAGLHKRLIKHINQVKPPLIAYLSCNPSTQARDVAELSSQYDISYARGYNFFPATPHIESLIVLSRRLK